MRTFFWLAVVLPLFAPAGFSAPSASPSVKGPPESASSEVSTDADPAEKAPRIEGIELARKGGGFLGVQTVGVSLKVTFYDAKKKKVAADAVRIAARWHDVRIRRTVLLPVDAETMVSPSVISRPFDYILYLVLVGADEQPIETFSLKLNGSDAPPAK